MHVHHVEYLALRPPAIQTVWVSAVSAAGRLVGEGNGLYLGHRRRTAVVTGIATLEDSLCVQHEIAHDRVPSADTGLERECLAWEHCREHALFWNERCQQQLAFCIGTYLSNVRQQRDVFRCRCSMALASGLSPSRSTLRRSIGQAADTSTAGDPLKAVRGTCAADDIFDVLAARPRRSTSIAFFARPYNPSAPEMSPLLRPYRNIECEVLRADTQVAVNVSTSKTPGMPLG
jgi:hypothetical protein